MQQSTRPGFDAGQHVKISVENSRFLLNASIVNDAIGDELIQQGGVLAVVYLVCMAVCRNGHQKDNRQYEP